MSADAQVAAYVELKTLRYQRDVLRHVMAKIAAAPEDCKDAGWMLSNYRQMAIDALEITK